MKRQAAKLLVVLLGASAASMAFAQTAEPGTGKVTFNGELIDETCEITAGDDNLTVTLPKVSTKSLAKAGDTAGSTRFAIAVKNCPADLSQVAAHFETTNIDSATSNAKNMATNPATNVTVQLLDADGITPIKLGSTGGFQPIVSGGATLNYAGQYYATGATTAGPVNTFVLYTLAYN